MNRTLFVVFIGLNDYFFKPNADPQQVVSNVMSIVQKIWDNGGTDFLIPRVPALGFAPYFAGSPQAAQLNQLCEAHNNFLNVRNIIFFPVSVLQCFFPCHSIQ